MKSDLLSQGSLCLKAPASEPAEAQANTIWRLEWRRKATYSCFPYKAHFLQLLGCDLLWCICFQIAVNKQGQIIYKSQEGILEQKHLSSNQSVASDGVILGRLCLFPRMEEFLGEL